MNLLDLSHRVASHPQVARLLSYKQLVTFCDIFWWLKPEISACQPPSTTTPPNLLPPDIQAFLATVFSLQEESVSHLWTLLCDVAWEEDPAQPLDKHRAHSLVTLFLQYGPAHNLCFYNLRPPVRECLDHSCARKRARLADGSYELRPRALAEPRTFDAVVFSRELGPLPARVISLYCRGCHTRYYPNYFVHEDASTRTYYRGLPSFIQITQKSYVSAEVCEMFATLMNTSWTSATNCAQFYNLSCSNDDLYEFLPHTWKLCHELNAELVWDAFFTYSLLLEHKERQKVLELAHNAVSHAERLRPAIQGRNLQMEGPGQEQWSHACNQCCWVYTDDDGHRWAIRSAVTDGVAVGYPCCGVHDCKEPIVRRKGARYCATHAAKEDECSVTGCEAPAEGDFKTCALTSHRALEERYKLQHKAMFQLRTRLERLNAAQHAKTLVPEVVSVPSSSNNANGFSDVPVTINTGAAAVLDTEENILEPPPEAECEEKSAEGNRRLHALFGRRRTHNDELCVASCGVILGRATFMGSEAINGVVEFWRRLFPTRTSLPPVMWHDQNCRVWSMINNADEDTQAFFKDIALPVDVFHFKCKHKETDVVCGTHCNPYIWPELRTDDDQWRFNSSAAEQTNVWYGKYQAIVREMDVDRANFFLDENCKRRNRITVARLERKGHCPYIIPRETLLDLP